MFYSVYFLQKGDSGAGLIQGGGNDAMVVGIASETMSPCAGPNFNPSIFTNVGRIHYWIDHVLQNV
jgi:secreted trypsin-like serine protease